MPTGFYPRKSLRERFLEKVIVGQGNDCWIWIGAIGTHGYGRIGHENKTLQAHRVSFELHKGPLGEKWVLHSCDNRKCVNPEHLSAGDRIDNVRDCISKKRHIFGERSSLAKLNIRQVREIYRLLSTGLKQREVAVALGISQSNVSKIITGKSWKGISA